jgi:hypothetical protein
MISGAGFVMDSASGVGSSPQVSWDSDKIKGQCGKDAQLSLAIPISLHEQAPRTTPACRVLT